MTDSEKVESYFRTKENVVLERRSLFEYRENAVNAKIDVPKEFELKELDAGEGGEYLHPDAGFLGIADKIPNDEIVVHIAHLADDANLILQSLGIFCRRIFFWFKICIWLY